MGKYATAAKEMLRWLYKNDLKGGPVTQPSKRHPVIVVWEMTEEGVAQLPPKFHDFKVEGRAEPFDYLPGRALRHMIPRPKGPLSKK